MLQVQYLNTVAADHMVIGTPQRGKRHPQITISTGSIDTPSRSPPHICILVISRTESMASLTSRRPNPPGIISFPVKECFIALKLRESSWRVDFHIPFLSPRYKSPSSKLHRVSDGRGREKRSFLMG